MKKLVASVICPFCGNKVTIQAERKSYVETMEGLRHGLLDHLAPEFNDCSGLPDAFVV